MPPIPQSIADGLARYAQFREAQLIGVASHQAPGAHYHGVRRLPADPLGRRPGTRPPPADVAAGARRRHGWQRRRSTPADPQYVRVSSATPREVKRAACIATTWPPARSRSSPRRSRGSTPSGHGRASGSPTIRAERNGKDRDLYVIQPSDPKTKRLLTQVEGPCSPQDWSPDGTLAARDRGVQQLRNLRLADRRQDRPEEGR